MTNSDRHMDADLRALSSLAPARSVWPEVERQLDSGRRRRRRRRIAGVVAPAVAACLVIVVAIHHQQAERAEESLRLQQTVDKAVRDARARTTVSGLELTGERRLDTLLVSAKPRRTEAQALRPEALEAGRDGLRENVEINEF